MPTMIRAAIAYGKDSGYSWRFWLWVRDAWHLGLFAIALSLGWITTTEEEDWMTGPWRDCDAAEWFGHPWLPIGYRVE